MASTSKTSLGLNMWEASDKPVRQDFINDNHIINESITELFAGKRIGKDTNILSLRPGIYHLEGSNVVSASNGFPETLADYVHVTVEIVGSYHGTNGYRVIRYYNHTYNTSWCRQQSWDGWKNWVKCTSGS